MPTCAVRARCQTNRCRGHASVLCRYPVTRNGRSTRCNRHVCGACASDGFCPPHARAGAAQLVRMCSRCYMQSCAYGDMRCPNPGPVQLVTHQQWLTLISFGVL